MSTNQRIDLDDRQRAAVHAPTDPASTVMAGAGTGKTRVLVARYVRLVGDEDVPIDRVLALTFTLKAAGEMRERVRAEITRVRPGLVPALPRAWIMNFHQFGFRFIKENAPALGVDPGVDVVSLAEFKRIHAAIRARFEGGRVAGIAPGFGGDSPSPTKLPALFQTLMDVVHKCRGNMMDVSDLLRLCGPDEHPAYRARVEAIVALAREYEAELTRRNLLDFSDMITLPVRGMREVPALAARWQGAFAHILVDEFQDTSEAQNELLRMLSGGAFERVTVVGDMKQSIYRWRDARVENLRDFPARESVDLLYNYRSTQRILDLAHALVTRAETIAEAKPLRARRDGPDRPVLLFHPRAEGLEVASEAEAVAAWVAHLLGLSPAPEAWNLPRPDSPLHPGEVAILLRRFAGSPVRPALEDALHRRGIPYAVVGGANTAEARALDSWHALLSLLLPGDRTADLLAVLEVEPFRVSEASLFELFSGRPGPADTESLLAAERVARVGSEADRGALHDLRALVESLREARARLGLRGFLVWTFDRSPLRLRLAAGGVSSRATDDILREVLDLADTLARRGEFALADFLEHLRASLEDRKFREDVDVRLPGDRVALMTIHQAKGLEFRAVAVPGNLPAKVRDDGFLLSRATGVYFASEEARDAWNRHRRTAENYDDEKAMEELEERCVLYVAMTRARDHLWVSSPRADGAEPRKTKEAKGSLFTELVECARGTDLAVELRDAPEAAPAAGDTGAGRGGTEDLAALLAEWSEARASADLPRDPRRRARPFEMVTWSGLARFAACPLAFALDREAGRSLPAVDSGVEGAPPGREAPAAVLPAGADPAAFGAFVHAALEALARDEACDLADALARLWRRFAPGGREEVVIDAARALIEPARAHGLAGYSAGARIEEPFAVRADAVVVRGVIDRLDESSRGALVTDYKTGEADAAHAFQTRVYTWAVDRARGEKCARGRVVYLRAGEASCEDVATPETSAKIEQMVLELDRALSGGEFRPAPGSVCADCPHRSTCPHAAR